jgi:hypothetical protein
MQSKAESDFEFSSIQCAQRQATYSGKKEIVENTTEEKQDNVHIDVSLSKFLFYEFSDVFLE